MARTNTFIAIALVAAFALIQFSTASPVLNKNEEGVVSYADSGIKLSNETALIDTLNDLAYGNGTELARVKRQGDAAVVLAVVASAPSAVHVALLVVELVADHVAVVASGCCGCGGGRKRRSLEALSHKLMNKVAAQQQAFDQLAFQSAPAQEQIEEAQQTPAQDQQIQGSGNEEAQQIL
uniref:DUF148 domain-containing protein n=1 Tax=Rhabditophanes sp. KR3021 TaxID=114890 RepID=A0AC35TNF9_9BILA